MRELLIMLFNTHSNSNALKKKKLRVVFD
jgi:hypothetical protein